MIEITASWKVLAEVIPQDFHLLLLQDAGIVGILLEQCESALGGEPVGHYLFSSGNNIIDVREDGLIECHIVGHRHFYRDSRALGDDVDYVIYQRLLGRIEIADEVMVPSAEKNVMLGRTVFVALTVVCDGWGVCLR